MALCIFQLSACMLSHSMRPVLSISHLKQKKKNLCLQQHAGILVPCLLDAGVTFFFSVLSLVIIFFDTPVQSVHVNEKVFHHHLHSHSFLTSPPYIHSFSSSSLGHLPVSAAVLCNDTLSHRNTHSFPPIYGKVRDRFGIAV